LFRRPRVYSTGQEPRKQTLMEGMHESPKQLRVRTREGRFDLDALVVRIGSDWLVSIWGGERPHIGAVAMAQPRASLEDPRRGSATASVFCFLGHKEDVIVKEASERLSTALGAPVVVTAGAHWDNIDSEGIRRVLENSRKLVTLIEEGIREWQGTREPGESS
jgi:gallate decarboxylase subunit D